MRTDPRSIAAHGLFACILRGATLTTQFYLKGDTDLAGDFIVRRLGKAIERVLIDAQPEAGTAARQATLDVVTGRAC